MAKKKTFFFKKKGKFVDIGRVDKSELDMLPPSVFKEFFGGYDKVQARDFERAIGKATMGKKTKVITTGKVVKIVGDMM